VSGPRKPRRRSGATADCANDVPVKFEEGGAYPGLTHSACSDGKGGIGISRSTRHQVKDYEHERWIDVSGTSTRPAGRASAKIRHRAQRPGTLAQIRESGSRGGRHIDNCVCCAGPQISKRC